MSNDEKKKINIPEIKGFWLKEALEALNVADHLYEKNDYSYSLFFGHLAIEKLLKGLFVLKKRNMLLISTICKDLRKCWI